jgi:hypothetical protein
VSVDLSPELISLAFLIAGLACGIAGGRMELSTLPPKPEPTEGTDDASPLPAEDL